MRKEDMQRDFHPTGRTSQIVYGERQHLRTVLDSIVRFRDDDLDDQQPLLERLIDARTDELNRINPDWDQQMEVARDRNTSPQQLAMLAKAAPEDDWLLLRTVAEHQNTPASVLSWLSRHPYLSIRETIARHGNADAETLERLAAEEHAPLWVLVAGNGAAPVELRQKLLKRLQAVATQEEMRV